MNIEKLEKEIKTLKTELQKELKGEAAPLLVRKARKKLKRAQRKKNCMSKRAAFIASKVKKEPQKTVDAKEEVQETEKKEIKEEVQ